MRGFRRFSMHTGMLLAGWAMVGMAFAAGQPDMQEPAGFSIGVSHDYSKGNYGTRFETKARTTTVNAEYESGDFLFAASIPYIRQHGPVGAIIVRGRPVVRNGQIIGFVPGRQIVFDTVSGIGDVNLSGTWFYAADAENAPLFNLKFNIKLGTADEDKGLGTGKRDYSLQGGVSQSFGPWIASGSFGYTVTGKIDSAELRNYFFGAVDLSRKVGDRGRLGASWSAGQSFISGGDNSSDLTLYYSRDLGRASRLYVYLLRGFSDASPDRGAGVDFSMSF